MEIKKFQTSAPAVGPIGLVRPSNAGVRAAEGQMRMGQQLLDSAFKLAVDRQQEEGKEFAASYTFARNPDGSLNVEDYSAIIEEADLSKVARASAKPLLNQRYLNATKVDISNAANAFRYNQDADGKPDLSSPANEDQFVSNFQSYIAETAKLSGDLGGAVSDLGAAVQVQHVQDIRNKAVKAALDTDKENMLTIIKKTNDDILAMSVSGTTSGQFAADGETDDVGVILGQLYAQQMANIDQLQAKHASRIGDDVVPNLKKQLRKSFFGGQANGMAVNVMQQAGGGASYDSYSRGQFLLNRMSMTMTNPALYDSLSPFEKRIFERAGFTKEFVTSSEFVGIRDEVASKITVLEGKLAQEFNTTRVARINQDTELMLVEGKPVGAKQAGDYLTSVGIQTPFDVLREFGKGEAGLFAEGAPLRQMITGRSMLPAQVTNIFSPDILADLTAQGQLGNALNMYYTMTRDFGDFGTETRLQRNLSNDTVLLMESMGRYSSSMQPVKMEEWFQKTADFNLKPVAERRALVTAELANSGNENEKTLDGFLQSVLGKDITADERQFFRPLTEKYIAFYGIDGARQILQESKDTIFTTTNYFRPVEIGKPMKTRFAPEAIMGKDELVEFDRAVDSVLTTLSGGGKNMLGQTHYLAPTRQRGTYLIIHKESGLMAIDDRGQPLYVNANAILKARGMRLRQRAALEQQKFQDLLTRDTPQKRIQESQFEQLDAIMQRAQQ
jgi:hypothetical protein